MFQRRHVTNIFIAIVTNITACMWPRTTVNAQMLTHGFQIILLIDLASLIYFLLIILSLLAMNAYGFKRYWHNLSVSFSYFNMHLMKFFLFKWWCYPQHVNISAMHLTLYLQYFHLLPSFGLPNALKVYYRAHAPELTRLPYLLICTW